MRVLERELAAAETADLAVFLVGAEGRVDPFEPREEPPESRLVHAVVPHVDEDRHPHDVLDAARAGKSRRRDAHTFASADWSDCSNAWLV